MENEHSDGLLRSVDDAISSTLHAGKQLAHLGVDMAYHLIESDFATATAMRHTRELHRGLRSDMDEDVAAGTTAFMGICENVAAALMSHMAAGGYGLATYLSATVITNTLSAIREHYRRPDDS